MVLRLPLQGVRVHLSGSVPESSTPEQSDGIRSFVQKLSNKIFSEGGTVIHGSHPTFSKPLEGSAKDFVRAGGQKDSLTLVRAQKFAETDEQLAEIDFQRQYANVQIVPAVEGNPNESLIPMREWMAEISDAVICIGGKWWGINKSRAGVPAELDTMLSLGKPGFVVAGFGGATAGYVQEDPALLSRLQNGLSVVQNREIADSTSVDDLVNTIITQLKLLPLVRQSVSRGRNFRILALDGGGLRGTFTAAVLAKWDDMIKSGGGNNLVAHFDLVAGTSTGAILAIGLGLGLTPLEMLTFYRNEGPKIFPKNRQLRHWLKSKHESTTLRSVLQAVFCNRKLSYDSCCRLVIPTVRAIHGEAEAIVTAHSPDRTAFRDISAVDAALASSAAPTYFDEAVWEAPVSTETFLDGGIWANNPVLPALAEAVRHLKIPLDRIDVLSVGTMGNETDFVESLGKGKAGWAPTSADLFFAAQEHAAATLAVSFLGPTRHLRVNQQTPSAIKLDDKEAIEDMALRGNNVGKDSFIAVRSRFLDGIHVPDWRR
ncbi:patatin-like phospholipase family protein [Prosthecochloris sp. N3]|uniref:Patatin-like phospholipase family protein n=1 Tax=Prosthecochloris ethylica TaxID=2743976 RepID=A0ABR9XR96_9CHLB|nr:CBASS cGAMP-activated phospholipase [Prosthecochloris ethylica]MBF0586057.1 patatin-like phospholipase family protein [Prosthecochloris ethylica]MBF0636543.1 patatin-like phospholipase family protein [Prosthecochloris ethylica]NUK47175.1 patatin-like phospholipase family protein [Prosthecochloris ethylica]